MQATEGTLYFAPGEDIKNITVKIMDDDVGEPDIAFHVVLTHVGAVTMNVMKHVFYNGSTRHIPMI